MDCPYQPQPVRPRQYPGQKKTHDCRHANLMADEDHKNRQSQYNNNIIQQLNFHISVYPLRNRKAHTYKSGRIYSIIPAVFFQKYYMHRNTLKSIASTRKTGETTDRSVACPV